MRFGISQSVSKLVELNPIEDYPIIMMKRFSHLAACLLLVLMPLQALAAANLMVCNSLMQAGVTQYVKASGAMPCHQVASRVSNADQASDEVQSQVCKARCATLCASMHAITVDIQTDLPKNLSTAIDAYPVSYTSIAQQRLQRPPISFI